MKDNRKIKKIAVGLSGGVDSAVTAALLKEQGYEVIGVHMLKVKESISGCTSEEDRNDALRVAKKLEIPFRVVDFTKEYREQVIKRFLDEYQNGRTPNPDIWCNEVMKFGLFLEYALNELKVDAIATGHYAKIHKNIVTGDFTIHASNDSSHDQSNLLAGLPNAYLEKIKFPLADLRKDEVRRVAKRFHIPFLERRDSSLYCFTDLPGKIDFVEKKVGPKLREDGTLNKQGQDVSIGEHTGIHHFYIGQNNVKSTINSDLIEKNLFVVDIDAHDKRVVLGPEKELFKKGCGISELNFISKMDRSKPLNLYAQLGIGGAKIPVTVFLKNNSSAVLEFEQESKELLVGAAVVFYDSQKVKAKVVAKGEISYVGDLTEFGRAQHLEAEKVMNETAKMSDEQREVYLERRRKKQGNFIF